MKHGSLRHALLLLLLLACRGPHRCGSECESGLVASLELAPAPAPQEPAPPRPPAPPAPPLVEHASPSTSGLDAAAALAAFDKVWETVRDTHFDAKFNGVDWEAMRAEFRPRAEAAHTDAELRAILGEMLGRLGQSHFGVIPSNALPDSASAQDESGSLGFDVRLNEGHLLVSALEPGGAAAAAGVRPGWSVERIDAFDCTAAVARMQEAGMAPRRVGLSAWQAARARIFGTVGDSSEVVFGDAQDARVTLALVRRKRDVTAHEVGPTLPTFYLEFERRDLERNGHRIGYVRFSNWFLPMVKPMDAAIDEMRTAYGIVIDLRGNTGGAAAMTMGIAGHFFGEMRKLGVMLTRDSKMNIQAFPKRVNASGKAVDPYAGKLAILVDETTASASEVFAGGMQALGRARVFGSTSAGAVLPALTERLPNGDTLLHAMGDFETSTGVHLEGRGVVPDVETPLTRPALLAGKDPALDAALAWIAGDNP